MRKVGLEGCTNSTEMFSVFMWEDISLTESKDLANRLALDAMEAALADICPGEIASVCQAKHRFRIEQ